MEIQHTSSCRTCLGSVVENINLFNSTFKKYLEVLERLLGLQLFVDGELFTICMQCKDRIRWVWEFQATCLKSLKLLNVNCIEDLDVPLSISQTLPEIKVESSPEHSGVDDNYNTDTSDTDDVYIPKKLTRFRKSTATSTCKIQTRSSMRNLLSNRQNLENGGGDDNEKFRGIKRQRQDNSNHSPSKNKRQKQDNTDENTNSASVNVSKVSDNNSEIVWETKKRKCKVISKIEQNKSQTVQTKSIGGKGPRLQQFPSDEVAEAVADCRSYLNDLKHKQCIFCDYIGTNAPNLQLHVRKKHVNDFTTWCYRCNLITQNLEEHRESVKCSEQKCKFCGEVFTKMKYIKLHLEQHCRELYPLTVDNRASKDEPIWKLYQQYPEAEVLKAIADSTAYMTDLKNRSCLYCDFAGSTSRTLSFHLRLKHTEKFKNWCCRCNLNTDDLHVHMKTTKCSEFRCVFCNKLLMKQDKLTMHLKLHAGIDAGLRRETKKCKQKEISKDKRRKLRPGRKLQPRRLKEICNRGSRLRQYPADEVADAVADCRSYLNDLKHKQCIFCDYIGTNSPNLQLHVRKKHVNEFTTWCYRCSMITQNLQEHLDTVKCYEQKCKFCGEVFIKMKYIKLHLEQHCRELYPATVDTRASKDEPIWKLYEQYPESEVLQAIADSTAYMTDLKNRSCLYCDFVASTSRMLSFHLRLKHKEAFKNWCCRCNLYTDDLHVHMKTTKCSEIRCALCNKLFMKQDKLIMHLKLHCQSSIPEVEEGAFCCKDCRVSFLKEEDLEHHECKKLDDVANSLTPKKRVRNRSHPVDQTHKESDSNKPKNTEKSDKRRICPICGQTFMSNYLDVHISTHAEKMPYKCSFCGKGFASLPNFKTHERRHTGVKPYVCHVCGKAFVTSGEHKTHVQIHEGGPVTCTICNKECSRPGVLKLHMRRHTGENKFCCVDCGTSFHRKSLLLNHMRTHKNERPFKCSFCERDFSETSALRRHELVHKGIKPYKCTICSFSCVQAHGLNLHMKQHPEDAPQADRPHKCFFCYRQFTTNAMLMSHTNNYHKENTSKESSEKKIA